MGLLDTLHSTEQCSNCRFWHVTPEPAAGSCRRHSPATANGIGALWPLTRDNSWCGDYEMRLDV